MINNSYTFREIGVGHYPLAIHDANDKEIVKIIDSSENNKQNKLLYIHIPFCESLCPFCPYPKQINNDSTRKRYLDSIMNEINIYAQHSNIINKPIEAIYIGGGTPSILQEDEIKILFYELRKKFDLSKVEEITFEGNPHSFTKEKIILLKSLGVNRISIGVQTFDDKMAQRIGLIQREDRSVQIIEWCHELGIENISIDLMYNLPGQTIKDWNCDIRKAIDLNVDHISLFPLKVIPGFNMFNKIKNKEIPPCGDMEFEKKLYISAYDMLENYGYKINSTYDFAKDGKEHIYCRKHFKESYDLLALGMGAFGEVNGCIYQNESNIQKYCDKVSSNKLPISKWYKLEDEDLPNKYMAMHFRLLSVDRKDFYKNFAQYPEEKFESMLDELISKNLVENIGDKFVLTRNSGLFWGNNVSKEFFDKKFKNLYSK